MTDSAVQAQATERQDALRSYLDYYKKLTNPGYAVLVTGEWGCGKTYQVRATLEESEYHYISLFGLKSELDIYGAVLAKMSPSEAKAKKLSSFLDGKSVGVMGFSAPVGSLFSAYIDAFVRDEVDSTRLIIFDDLERCRIDVGVLLGVFNNYVEHHGCRVVVIAHDEKIQSEFVEAKEKVFGQTVRVTPRWHDAYDAFIKVMEDRPRRVLESHRTQIYEIFSISGCQSLRVLRQVLMDICRFIDLLTDDQISHARALSDLLALFAAIDVEVRSAQVFRSDLDGRIENTTSSMDKIFAERSGTGQSSQPEALSKFTIAVRKYSKVTDLNSLLLTDKLLINMLVDGNYDKVELQQYLSEIDLFKPPSQLPAWRRFMAFDGAEDADVAAATAEMDKQFSQREITDLGEILHIAFLKVMRAEADMLATSKESIISETKSYFDDLVRGGRFPMEVDWDWFGSHPAFGGVMLWGYKENREMLSELSKHAQLCERRHWQSSFPKIAAQLLNDLAKDPKEFHRALNYVDGESGRFATIPVLSGIAPTEFVLTFLNLPHQHWRFVQMALRNRKERISPNNSLAEEAKWFEAVRSEMEKRADAVKGTINAVRIRRHMPKA